MKLAIFRYRCALLILYFLKIVIISSSFYQLSGLLFSTSPSHQTRQNDPVPPKVKWWSSTSTFLKHEAQTFGRQRLFLSQASTYESGGKIVECNSNNSLFDLTSALFCAGLAFDAYAEPNANSPRWERGSRGTNVAFQSAAFAKCLYRGIVEIVVKNATDLPDEDDNVQSLLSGGGVDPYLLTAVVEGDAVSSDVQTLADRFSGGVVDLQSSAHLARSKTAWSNVNEKQAKNNVEKNRQIGGSNYSTGYYIASSWGRGGQAIWLDEPPLYLYVRDPLQAWVVCTLMDEDLYSTDDVIGSVAMKLSDIFPKATFAKSNAALVDAAKKVLLDKLKTATATKQLDVNTSLVLTDNDILNTIVQRWEGVLPLKSKPKKKDKKGQIALGAAVGAYVAGPAGAAVGGILGSFFEEGVRGKLGLHMRYLPIPTMDLSKRKRYEVKGGLPGVNWGQLYREHLERISLQGATIKDIDLAGDDLEFCAFVTNEETGCSCAVYRSLEKRMIAVSFRGTCAPKDLVTDASILQTPWVEGENAEDENATMVHGGFRTSLNSISRRLKELILAAVAPKDDLSSYQLFITGHSLGGALATLFATDVAEFGMDAGRGLPQLEPSEPWWGSLLSLFASNKDERAFATTDRPPPRPKTLKLYSFGSPRVGNEIFVKKFSSLCKSGKLNEAYRVVNGADVVARLPRSVNFLLKIGYDHCGATALVSLPKVKELNETIPGNNTNISNIADVPLIWVEGESDDSICPVRDGTPLTSPLGEGMLLGDLFSAVMKAEEENKDADKVDVSLNYISKLGEKAGKISKTVAERFQTMTATDLTSIFGIDKKYAEREAAIIQSILSGEAIAHHLEDEYYSAMGRACGFIARVGEPLIAIKDSDEWQQEMENLSQT